MDQREKLRDIVIGVLGVGFAFVVLLLWIPADIDTGVLDVWRRNVRIGDAMLPTFATVGILLSAVVIAARAILNRPSTGFRIIHPLFLILSTIILAVSLTLMWVTGPLLATLWHGGDTPYRLLLATAPWKYMGFICGGTVMVFCFSALASHKVKRQHAIIAVIATLVIAMLYDLPFDTLLLPPNGDF